MASPQTKPAAAPQQGDWQELARVLLDEADTSALTALAASHTPT